MFKKFFQGVLLGALIGTQAVAGLPPTTIQGQSDTSATTKFSFQVPRKQFTDLGGIKALIETGNKNYIKDPGAEGGATAFSLYTDTAKNIPATCAGAAGANVTFSRSTSSPLSGTGSFSYVQANSTSVQGYGVAAAFTIDSTDQAKVLTISFDYNASSTFVASDGTTSPLNDNTTSTNAGNSDLEVFVYDVTNATLVPVSPQVITSNGTNNAQFRGTFQSASNSTSYRACLHSATTSANATGYTFKFDNVFVGAQPVSVGSGQTDWTSYTPTFTGFGTVTTSGFYWRRSSSNVEIRGVFTSGTPTATEARISLPSGLTSDSTYGTVEVVGNAASSTTNQKLSPLEEASKTYFTFGIDNSTTADHTKVNGNGLATAGSTTSVNASIRVAGWASTTVMSQDTDTRVVAASIALAADYAVSANAVIKFDTVLFDTHSSYSTSTGLYTAPVSGQYRVSATISTTSTAAGIYVGVNGTGKVYLVTPANSPEGGSQTVNVKAGDTIGVYSDSTKTIDGTSTPYFSVISIERLTGPATIATSDTVSARYYASATSISGSLATISWTTKDWDDHGAMSAGTYTIPAPGKYQINAGILESGTFVLNSKAVIEIQKNGTVATRQTTFAGGAETDMVNNVSDIVNCVAGDTIRIQASNNGTGPAIVSSNVDNYFSINRIGN